MTMSSMSTQKSDGYEWEKGTARTWESVQEDEFGNIVTSDLSQRAKRAKLHRITNSVRRGLIRYVVIVLDCSAASAEKDLAPNRLECCKAAMIQFVNNFFDANPLSHCSIIITKDRTATTLSDMSANPKYHINKIRNILAVADSGSPSLQNSLLLATRLLKHVPKYCTREVIVLYNSIGTSDPGNIYATVETLNQFDIKANILCLAAEVFICKTVCEMTQGSFSVILNNAHLVESLQYFSTPPAVLSDDSASTTKDTASFILMGFPVRKLSRSHLFSFDSTSFDFDAPAADGTAASILSTNRHIKMCNVGYICPRCNVRMTDIPSECHVCGLRLISSAHIARSHHHLYPLENNDEVVPQSEAALVNIYANVNVDLEDEIFLDTSEEEDDLPEPEDDDEEYQEKAYKRAKVADGSAVATKAADNAAGTSEMVEVKTNDADSESIAPALAAVAGSTVEVKSEFTSKQDPSAETKNPSTEVKPPSKLASSSSSSASKSRLKAARAAEALALAAEEEKQKDAYCYGCLQRFGDTVNMVSKSRCRTCNYLYCVDCDLFIHDSLHNCPGDSR